MPVKLVAERVEFADVIHKSKALSDLIQRRLKGERASIVAHYLSSTDDRFFNSLVLAIYGGQPEWLEVDAFQAQSSRAMKSMIPEFARDAIGFLHLNGDEKIFAVDGQHRLAGIRKALESGTDIGEEQLSVIFIGHRETQAGFQRTRRLFTTLNKTAIPVNKADIIALDEDDAMAITIRRLVDNNPKFKDPKILITPSSSLPATNTSSLTQISNLYDVLRLMFRAKLKEHSDFALRFNRLPEQTLDKLYELAVNYFEALEQAFPEVQAFFAAMPQSKIPLNVRGKIGGHLIFRPIGLELFTKLSVEYAGKHLLSLADAVYALRDVPTELCEEPYEGVIWNSNTGRIITNNKKVAFDLLRYMVGLPVKEKLLERYREIRSDQNLELPKKLI